MLQIMKNYFDLSLGFLLHLQYNCSKLNISTHMFTLGVKWALLCKSVKARSRNIQYGCNII